MTAFSHLPLATALALLPAAAIAQNVIPDNTTIRDKLCVGGQCANTEGYGDDTSIRMDDYAMRIHFDDKSTGTWPANDWRIVVNDNIQNGANYFAVEDTTAGVEPFRIDAGARPAGIYLTGDGDVGLGTAMPLADLHILDEGPNPALRMTGAMGSAMNWEFVAGEESFRIAQWGSLVGNPISKTTPFRISTGAPTNSIIVNSGGKVGIGSNLYPSTSGASLQVRRDDNTAAIVVEDTGAGTLGQLILRNNGITYFTLEDSSRPDVDYSGRAWNFQNQNGTFRVTTPPGGPGEIEMMIEPDGDMHIKGRIYTGGSCNAGCDAVFDADYPLPTLAEQMAMIRAQGHLPNIGPTSENGPFDLSGLSTGMLNELEKAYLYIDQLDARNARLETRVTDMQAQLAVQATALSRLAALETRLSAVESQP